jgi:hypothetical protein
MYSSSSSDAMENQITIALSGGMEETIIMLIVGSRFFIDTTTKASSMLCQP